MSTFEITIDERLRLVTAVLAASDWPDDEQQQLTHAVHPQAKKVRHFVQPFQGHPAAQGVNDGLLNGVAPNEFFSVALRATWPDFTPTTELPRLLKIKEWLQSLADFGRKSAIFTDFWPQEAAVWQEAKEALSTVFAGKDLLTAFGQLKGSPVTTAVSLMPNLVYPALTPAVATTDQALTLLLPPPKAVGESPPWPFDEDPGWVIATVSGRLVPYLLTEELTLLDRTEQRLALYMAVAHCLAYLFDEFEAQAYLLRTKKERDLPQLPLLFTRLENEIAAENGRPFAALFQK